MSASVIKRKSILVSMAPSYTTPKAHSIQRTLVLLKAFASFVGLCANRGLAFKFTLATRAVVYMTAKEKVA